MSKKLGSQVSNSIKYTSEELPAELIDLSEEDLQQIVGGAPFFTVLNGVINGHTKAVSSTVNGLFSGHLPDKETAKKVVVPLELQFVYKLFF